MKEKYLIINAGSSSLKFSLYEMPDKKEIANGYFEKIGAADSFYTLKFNNVKMKVETEIRNHTEAVIKMFEEIEKKGLVKDTSEIIGVGHRVLHGATEFDKSVLIDEEVLEKIDSLKDLGTLHQPVQSACIKSTQEFLPGVPQVAAFDTAFHQTMPEVNCMYPIPYDLADKHKIRRYGFHGQSHKYIATDQMPKMLGKDNFTGIVCHLGSGCSLCLVVDGKSYDTTMGFTPASGTMMGTRAGDIDPSIIKFISEKENLNLEQIDNLLNKKSGFLGVAGNNDLRDVEELYALGDERAKLAIDLFVKSVVDYINKYIGELGQLKRKPDAIVFTGGIGENAIPMRERIIDAISFNTGIELDKERNSLIAGYKDQNTGIITEKTSKIPVYVVPTDEEKMILNDTISIVNNLNKDKELEKENSFQYKK